MLGLPGSLFTTQHASSTRAGTEALITLSSFIACSKNKRCCGLLIAADAPEADPKDPAEHGLGAGAVAFLIRKGKIYCRD